MCLFVTCVQELSLVETLHCVQTAFTILGGQGSALNIDPMKFYTHLYNALLHVHAASCADDAPVVLDCLEAAIIRRKKQVGEIVIGERNRWGK
jgi:nucleolar complex protein 3